MPARWAIALAAALVAAACGAPLTRLPAGPGTPAPDAADALAAALDHCHTIRTLTAEIAVSGVSGGRRVRGRLAAGVAAPDSARLEAIAPFGQPLFVFVATGHDATLWLPRDDRVLAHERPEVVLDAVAGVPLSAAELRAMIAGCASEAPEAVAARAFGDAWRVVPAGLDGELYLHRESTATAWRLVAVIGRGGGGQAWRAEYRSFEHDLPRTIRVTSIGSSAFDLQLALSQVDVNVPLEADVFRVKTPPSVNPITVDELRRAGPLARRTSSSPK